MYDQDASERSRAPASAREKVADVAETARYEMGTVADEVKHQAGRVASDVRGRLTEQARHRQEDLADRARQTGEELRAMASDREPSPARTTVEQLASRTDQVADYLSKHGPEELLADLQDFARRRPGVFLASAAVAGFVVGRLAKGVVAERSAGQSSTYRSTSPGTTAYDDVPPVAVGVASAPEPAYTSGVAPVPAAVAAEPVPLATAPPAVPPPTTTPPPATGGERR